MKYILQEPSPLTYKRGDVISLPIKRQFETIEITPEVSFVYLQVNVVWIMVNLDHQANSEISCFLNRVIYLKEVLNYIHTKFVEIQNSFTGIHTLGW